MATNPLRRKSKVITIPAGYSAGNVTSPLYAAIVAAGNLPPAEAVEDYNNRIIQESTDKLAPCLENMLQDILPVCTEACCAGKFADENIPLIAKAIAEVAIRELGELQLRPLPIEEQYYIPPNYVPSPNYGPITLGGYGNRVGITMTTTQTVPQYTMHNAVYNTAGHEETEVEY